MSEREYKVDPFSVAILVSAIEEGSITKAAIRHHISQPAASQRIKELESVLATTLLARSGPTVRATDDAVALLGRLRAVLDVHSDLISAAEKIRAENSDAFKLAVSMTIAEYLLPIWLSELKSRKEIEVENVEIGNTAHVIEVIEQGKAEIGLIEGASSPPNLLSKEIYHDQLVLVATPKHLETKRLTKSLNPRAIPKCDFILREHGSGTRDVFEIEISKLSPTHSVILTLPSTTAIKGAVARSMGIGVVSRLAVSDELSSGQFVEVKIQSLEMSRTLRAIYRKGRVRPGAMMFLNAIETLI
ncbi:MAG: LysR family transcriptional regulator [Actinomycetota bacterium]|nr:LysR family transcriptional regulator [Actinomycetota bacterium]